MDGTIIAATLGIVALAPYRTPLRNRGSSGWYWGEPPQCWRQRAARLARHTPAGVVDAGRWRNVAARTVSHHISYALSRQAVRRGGARAWGAAEPAAVDRRITVSWLTSVLGEGFAPSTSLVTL